MRRDGLLLQNGFPPAEEKLGAALLELFEFGRINELTADIGREMIHTGGSAQQKKVKGGDLDTTFIILLCGNNTEIPQIKNPRNKGSGEMGAVRGRRYVDGFS